MSVSRLIDVVPVVRPDELIAGLVPPPRFDGARFATFTPNPVEPSQAAALATLASLADGVGEKPRKGWFRRSRPTGPGGVYLDGGFGVGKTHLLASLWHAVPGPKAYGTFVEYTHLVGALGFAETVTRLSRHRLLAVDEFELDDPGDTMLMTRLLAQLDEAGVRLAATSNTLPGKLGEGRFAAEDFRREISSLSDRFQTVRIDGPDYRHSGLARAPRPGDSAAVADLAAATPGATLDDQPSLTRRLAALHPSTYGRLVEKTSAVHLLEVMPLADQSAALRWVVLIDRLYDRRIPVRSSGVPLDELFTPDMLRGGYRKKYLRATSRITALAREGG